MKNQIEIAITLLEYGAPSDSTTKMGVTPLHLAAEKGHSDMCSVLLTKDAQVNAAAKVRSLIFYLSCFVFTTKQFCSCLCNWNFYLQHGLTPMHLAAQEDRVSVAKVLHDHGSLVDPLTKSGKQLFLIRLLCFLYFFLWKQWKSLLFMWLILNFSGVLPMINFSGFNQY